MSLNVKAFLAPGVAKNSATPPGNRSEADGLPDTPVVSPIATNLRRLRAKRLHLRSVSGAPYAEETWPGVFGLLAGEGGRHEG